MPDLWGYKKEALLRAAKVRLPGTVTVDLFSGLYASAVQADGKRINLFEDAFNGLLTCADFQPRD